MLFPIFSKGVAIKQRASHALGGLKGIADYDSNDIAALNAIEYRN